jgi:alpha-L-fucosidase
VSGAWVLRDAAKVPLKITRVGGETRVSVPPQAPDPIDTVVVLDLKGRPRAIAPPVHPAKEGNLRLDYMFAITRGRAAKTFNRKGGFHISRWQSPADRAVWQVQVPSAGRYLVRLTYSAREGWQDGRIVAKVGADVLQAPVHPTGEWYSYRSFEIGEAKFARAGVYTVTLSPAAELAHTLVYLQSVELLPMDARSGAGATHTALANHHSREKRR